jgi:hypothetical protein
VEPEGFDEFVPERAGGFDPTLMQSIQNDPCIHPRDWRAAYRAARRGEREWWLAAEDSAPDGEGPTARAPLGREIS